jgi:hypothetical protein
MGFIYCVTYQFAKSEKNLLWVKGSGFSDGFPIDGLRVRGLVMG